MCPGTWPSISPPPSAPTPTLQGLPREGASRSGGYGGVMDAVWGLVASSCQSEAAAPGVLRSAAALPQPVSRIRHHPPGHAANPSASRTTTMGGAGVLNASKQGWSALLLLLQPPTHPVTGWPVQQQIAALMYGSCSSTHQSSIPPTHPPTLRVSGLGAGPTHSVHLQRCRATVGQVYYCLKKP